MNKPHFDAAVKFGRHLIETGDLDPVYVALMALPLEQRVRTVLAYACLYHLGAAGYIGAAKGEDFWELLELAALNTKKDWPRGSERRHWRAKNALDSVEYFRSCYTKPEQVIYNWYNSARDSGFSEVAARVRRAPGFGPWIAFKVADLMERCLDMNINFNACTLGIYDEPRRGAALLLTGSVEEKITECDVNEVITALWEKLKHLDAPPLDDRPVNVQEIETVLCKYKSHVNGHYPLGKDTLEVYHALGDPRWGRPARLMRERLENTRNQWPR